MDGSDIPVLPRTHRERKVVNHVPITFQRERFSDICTDLGPLMRKHDREIWPNRKWGKLCLDVQRYIQMENGGVLHVLTARANARTLIGYSFDIVMRDGVYGVSSCLNDHLFLHPDYRTGEGLSLTASPGFKFLKRREEMLDEMKIVRRRFSVKSWMMFGPLLERLGYEPEGVLFYKIVPQDE